MCGPTACVFGAGHCGARKIVTLFVCIFLQFSKGKISIEYAPIKRKQYIFFQHLNVLTHSSENYLGLKKKNWLNSSKNIETAAF